LLTQAETTPAVAVSETALERVAVYFAFRYLLKAVNDGDLLSRAKLCVFAVLTVERLAAVCGLPEALRRFSCEVEHSDENLEALLTALWQGDLEILPLENDFYL
jgi:lysine-N-methylase